MNMQRLIAKMCEARDSHKGWADYYQRCSDQGLDPEDCQNVGTPEDEREWVKVYGDVLAALRAHPVNDKTNNGDAAAMRKVCLGVLEKLRLHHVRCASMIRAKVGAPLSAQRHDVAAAVLMEAERITEGLPVPAPQFETGWLIGNGSDGYRTMDDYGNFKWTTDASEAIRFARKKDAERVSAEDEDAWTITHHMWPAGR